jgi:hypothetical protein
MKRKTDRKIQPLSGVSARMPVAMEKLSTVAMKTFLRPILSASEPQKNAPAIAPMPEDSRITADWPKVSCHGLMMKASTKPIRK